MKIGQGGFGSVYAVPVLPSLPSVGPLAVKVMARADDAALRNLRREIELLSACGHDFMLPLAAYCVDREALARY